LQLEHRVTILTGGIRDVDERARLQSEIDQLTAAKKDLEQQVSALDLEQRRAALAEELQPRTSAGKNDSFVGSVLEDRP
jgi:hypothetical protein